MEIKQFNNIQHLLGQKYLERFKVTHGETLFEPMWEALNQARCPLCSNCLKFSVSRGILYCNGKRHGNQFVIRRDVFARLGGTYTDAMLRTMSYSRKNA